jgi:ATP-dependent DNA helicase RecG
MKIAQLKSLVKKGESETLEFKSSTGGLPAGMQTVCAFLNSSHGGTVILGVTDKGQIVGQVINDKTKQYIATELNKIEPRTKIDVKYVKVSGDRQAIAIFVNPGEDAPYMYDGRAYTRNQSTTIRMSKEEYLYLHNINNPTLWEGLTNNKCKINDLDRKRIKEAILLAIHEKRLPATAINLSIPDVISKFNLIIDGKLTNAAVILFCKDEDKQFQQSNVQLARFKGTGKKEFLSKKLYHGNAFDLYDKAMDFLVSTLPVAARIEPGNPIRVETPAIPYNVLREAVTNALIHRDYSNSGSSIAIAIFDDRVNITNIGALPKGITLNKLTKQHPSIRRNPSIAHVFYLCGKIEKWGRGTLEMIDDCKKAGNPIPIYEEVDGSFSITLPFKEPIRTVIEQGEGSKARLTERQIKIIDVLRKGPLTRQELVDKMKSKLTERTLQWEITKLKKMGFIKTEGKGKATVWLAVE